MWRKLQKPTLHRYTLYYNVYLCILYNYHYIIPPLKLIRPTYLFQRCTKWAATCLIYNTLATCYTHYYIHIICHVQYVYSISSKNFYLLLSHFLLASFTSGHFWYLEMLYIHQNYKIKKRRKIMSPSVFFHISFLPRNHLLFQNMWTKKGNHI